MSTPLLKKITYKVIHKLSTEKQKLSTGYSQVNRVIHRVIHRLVDNLALIHRLSTSYPQRVVDKSIPKSQMVTTVAKLYPSYPQVFNYPTTTTTNI